jgi:hypothetical protein
VDLFAVMTEVDTRLKTVPGLRSTQIGAESAITPPAAVQYLPDRIEYDLTNGRGLDSFSDLVVVVFVGRANLPAALKAITPYLQGAGTKSIRRVLDWATAPYTSCSDFQVKWSEVDYRAQHAGGDFLAALFHCNAVGPGAT